MADKDPELIKPRTKAERAAFIHGFAEAVKMISDEGMDASVQWLRDMAEMDGLLQSPHAQN